MAYETLIVETTDHVGLIRLNRPEALNALNNQLMAELGEALAKFDADDSIGAIVVTGSEKAFAAGADIKEMKDQSFVDVFRSNFISPSWDDALRVRKPVIAAVSGYALGGGCELAMMCDIIIAGENAKFGLPEINLGVIPGGGGTQRLPRLVGKAKAMEMILTGRFMDAEEAERSNLVSRVVAADKVVDEAMAAAAKIAEKSLIAVMAAKESIARAYEGPLAEGLRFEGRMFHALFATEDQKEGMEAFIDKRQAQFKDR